MQKQMSQKQAIQKSDAQGAVYLDINRERVALTIRLVKQHFCPLATDAEAIMFIKMAKYLGANPFLRQIHLIKYDPRQPAQIVVSRDYFLQIATSQPNFRGLRSGVIVAKKRTQEITAIKNAVTKLTETAASTSSSELKVTLYELAENLRKEMESLEETELIHIKGALVPPDTELVGGWAEVHLRNPDNPDEPIIIYQSVMLSEYNKNQATWRQIPATMIQKVAESQALRRAFPTKLSGVYTPEELLGQQSHEVAPPIQGTVTDIKDEETKPSSELQDDKTVVEENVSELSDISGGEEEAEDDDWFSEITKGR